MKGMREFFSMIVTAVICFGMKVLRLNKKEDRLTVVQGMDLSFNSGGSLENRSNETGFGNGSVVSGGKNTDFGAKKVRETEMFRRNRPPVREVFHWKQGPGDRARIPGGQPPPAWREYQGKRSVYVKT